MKNLLESFAIFLVGVLTLGIVYFIIQYNMIQDEDVFNDVLTELSDPEEKSDKSATANYLENLEGYEDDEDLDLEDEEIDVTKDDLTNTVTVVAEEAESALDSAVEDKSKSSYMENLEKYSEKEAEPKTEEITPEEDTSGEPQKLEQEEIVDKVGMAIDAALEDL